MGDDLDRHISQQLRDPAFAAAWKESELGYRWSVALIKARLDAGLTQTELARRLGTRQPAIARLESGRMLPSADMLQRYAKVLNVHIEIGPDSMEVRPAA
jgi:ribosome-binding protein aMBF1 (putative translation factor)